MTTLRLDFGTFLPKTRVLHRSYSTMMSASFPLGLLLMTAGSLLAVGVGKQTKRMGSRIRARIFFNPYKCRRDEGQKTVRLWDLSAKDPASSRVILRGHEKHVGALDQLMAAGLSRVVGTRRLESGTCAPKIPHCPRPSCAAMMARSMPSPSPATADSSPAVPTALPRSGTRPLQTQLHRPLSCQAMKVRFLSAVTPDGRRVFTAGYGTTPRLWDLAAKAPSGSAIVLEKIEEALDWARISPNGRWLIAGGRSANASLTDLNAPNPASSYMKLRAYGGAVRKVAFSLDSHWLVTTTGYSVEELAQATDPEHVARLWDLTAEDPSGLAHGTAGPPGYDLRRGHFGRQSDCHRERRRYYPNLELGGRGLFERLDRSEGA